MAKATKKRGRAKGSKGPTKVDRINKLRQTLTKADIQTADKLVGQHSRDVLTLAYLQTSPARTSKATGVAGLASEIRQLPPDKAEKARELIAAIRAL